MPPLGKRSFHDGAWHYCGRCEDRTHIDTMQWQRGVLLCPSCVDFGEMPLIGQREVMIAKELDIPNSKELVPNPKLSDPDVGVIAGDDIIF